MSWWRSRGGLAEAAKLALAALVGLGLVCAGLYWLTSLAYHGLFH